MKKNMGNTDRVIRAAIVALIAALYYTEVISGTVAIILGVVAVIFLATSLLSFCPLYAIFGISTCPVKSESERT